MYISRLTLFVLTSVFAVADSWTVQEFCWSVWGAGLFYTWACVFFAVFHCILNARGDWKNRVWNPSFLQAFSPLAYLMTITPVVIVLGYFALRLCIILFEFYGLMLSVFAEMEPHELFGKNGQHSRSNKGRFFSR
ncbi:MAG TPA: hypothetical protein PLB62_11375, partial [Candidatus Sumerlaeota bacterium]|nr:hypothetical protein [Candidatus Sumerlaeota bacterium]